MTPSFAVKARNLQKSYGSFEALKSVDLSIEPEQIFGIVGTSGAGKTTLLKILSTLEKPDGGTLEILGQSVPYHNKQALKILRQKFGVIFQNYHLLSALNIYDNIALPLRILNHAESDIEKSVKNLLELTGLEAKKDQYPSFLSGGQKQRVAIARALVTHPKLLLCDEPTAALDPDTTHGILELLEDIRTSLKTTILIVTHEMGLIGSLCDSIAVVDKGAVEETGAVQEIFFNPQKKATQKLLNPRPPKAIDFVDKQHLDSMALVELKFRGDSAKAPLIAQLVERFHIYPNILQGSIDKMGPSTLGTLIVSFDKHHPNLASAFEFLRAHHVNITPLS